MARGERPSPAHRQIEHAQPGERPLGRRCGQCGGPRINAAGGPSQCIGARSRNCAAGPRGRRGEAQRRARCFVCSGPVGQLREHTPAAVLGAGQQVGHGWNDDERHALLETDREPFVGGAGQEAIGESRLQLHGATQPVAVDEIASVSDQVVEPEQSAERAPLRWRDDGNTDPAGLAPIDAEREVGCELVDAPAPVLGADAPGQRDIVVGQRQARLVGADLQPPSTGLRRVLQRRHAGDEGGQAGHGGGLVVRNRSRRSCGGADQLGGPRERPADGVGRLEIPIRAALAEPTHPQDDDGRIGAAQRCVIEARRRWRAGIGQIDDDIGVREQVVQALGGVGAGRQHGAAFVDIQEAEIGALADACGDLDQRRRDTAGIAARRLELEHLGAEVGEQPRAERAGRQRPDLGHPQV